MGWGQTFELGFHWMGSTEVLQECFSQDIRNVDVLCTGQPEFASIDSFGVHERSNTLFFFQIKSAGVVAVNGKWVVKYWDITVSNLASIKRCVYVHLVPAGEVWEKATKLREGGDWLTEASDDSKPFRASKIHP